MIRSQNSWHIWKWGIASVLSACGILAIFALQYSLYPHRRIAGERTAGLSALYSRAESSQPVALAVGFQTPEQLALLSPGPMIIRNVSLKFTSKNFSDVQARMDD